MTAQITVITAEKPRRLTKAYEQRGDELVKHNGGALLRGQAEIKNIGSLDGLSAVLSSLSGSQALCYGIPVRTPITVVTKKQWQREGKPETSIPRSKEAFSWPPGGGVLMIDYDPEPGKPPLSRDDVVGAIRDAIPALANVACIWWPSSSSHIIRVSDDEDLTGLRGQRIYFLVEDAADIERAGKEIETRLWAAGHGYVLISVSGQRLPRTLVDTSVWQTNRLDFAAGAACGDGLEQRRGQPVIIPGDTEWLDTATALPPASGDIRTLAERNQRAAMAEAAPKAQEKRGRYIEEKADEIAGVDGDEDDRQAAVETVTRALEHKTLSGDYPLVVVHDDGTQETVTAGRVLDAHDTYHGLLTLDPIEPDYDGGRATGKLYLMGARPVLYSFAHGGRTFKLNRQLASIELVRGRNADAVEAVLRVLRAQPDVFDYGGLLVLVSGGRTFLLDEHSLTHLLASITQFWKQHRLPNGEYVRVLEDPPSKVAKTLLSLGQRRELKQLQGVLTAQTIRPDGSLLCKPGFDELTGLLLDVDEDDQYPVPAQPSIEQVREALARLMRPFEDFPLVDMLDRSILLSALLTAVVRSVLPTSPAFGFDAPVQGSGKTLLAKCIVAIATGITAQVYPHASDEDEIRKRLMTILLKSPTAVLWDNVIGTFDSAAFAGLLTSATYSDRVLGASKDANVPNRAIWLLTGNNLSLAGDMPRRVLKCRIDPETERPFARSFDLDPEDYCLRHRHRMIADALTIIRGWFAAGSPTVNGRMASFELWDTMVRQPVVWIANHIAPFGDYDDPMRAVDLSQESDPEQVLLSDLLNGWHDVFGSDAVTAKDLLAVHTKVTDSDADARRGFAVQVTDGERQLADALNEFRGVRALTARSIGKVLQFREGRLVDGMRIRKRSTSGKHSQLWRVERV